MNDQGSFYVLDFDFSKKKKSSLVSEASPETSGCNTCSVRGREGIACAHRAAYDGKISLSI